MLNRYRWYRVQLPKACPSLEEIVSKHPLVEDSAFGFMRLESGIDAPTFRFFWRTKVVVTRLDVEGSPIYEEFSSVSFTDVGFVRIQNEIFLRILNPGRNIRDLLNALESLVGLGFTCVPVTFEKARPSTLFYSIEVLKLVGAKIVGAVIEEDLVARIDLVSKQGMELDKLSLLDGLHYKVDSAVYDLVYEGIRGQVAIASSGIVKLSGQLAPKLLHLLEQDLPELIVKK